MDNTEATETEAPLSSSTTPLAVECAAIMRRAKLIKRGSGPEWRRAVHQLSIAAKLTPAMAERAALAWTVAPYPATFEPFLEGRPVEAIAGELEAPLELERHERGLILTLRRVSDPATSLEDLEASAAKLSELAHTFIGWADDAAAKVNAARAARAQEPPAAPVEAPAPAAPVEAPAAPVASE